MLNLICKYFSLSIILTIGLSANLLMADTRMAYVWADKPDATEYEPSAHYLKMDDGRIQIKRTSKGRYLVKLGGITSQGANVQVSAYGGANSSCQVVRWNSSGAEVICFSPDGKVIDSRFTLLATKAKDDDNIAYLWADKPSSNTYTPMPQYSYAPEYALKITRKTVGSYKVDLSTSLANKGANIQVTTYGESLSHCGVLSWGNGSINVQCKGADGIAKDTMFSLLLVKENKQKWSFTWANDKGSASYSPHPDYTSTSGESPNIKRSSVGRYQVILNNQIHNIQVTSYGDKNSNCHSMNWNRAIATVNVVCFDLEGNSIDSKFTLLAISGGKKITKSTLLPKKEPTISVMPNKENPIKPTSEQATSFNLLPSKVPAKISLHLNKNFYSQGDNITATLDFSSVPFDGDKQAVLLVSSETKDIEYLSMSKSGDGLFSNNADHQVSIIRGESFEKLNGKLTAKPGERIVALFYTTPNVNRGEIAQIIADMAIFETITKLDNTLADKILVSPKLAEIDTKSSSSGERDFGSLLSRKSLPITIATSEVLFRPKNKKDLERFINFSNGKVDSYQSAIMSNAPIEIKDRLYKISVNLNDISSDHLPDLRSLFGEKDDVLVASEDVSKIYSLILESRMEGFSVFANQKLIPMSRTSFKEMTYGASVSKLSSDIDVPYSLAFNALWDGDNNKINVAFLDQGFIDTHPDFRKPASGEIRECNFDDGIINDLFFRGGKCADGIASSPPTVGNSFFGKHSWHGTGSVVTAGGMLNNSWVPGNTGDIGGSVGTGGQVVVPMLYSFGLSSYAYEMGAAMRQAVDDKASCINISFSMLCNVPSNILPDIDICTEGGQRRLCATLFLSVSAAAATVCASAPLLSFIPVIGPVIAGLTCGGATAAATTALPACQSFFFASGNLRSAMRVGAEYAENNGIPVVSSAGNQIQNSIPSELKAFINEDNIDAGEWGMIPATLPSVISAGAVNTSLTNEHFIGDSVDIWAPIPSIYHAPSDTDKLPSTTVNYERSNFGGTSSAAPFITGVIANMQAINPLLDPQNPNLSKAQKKSIPSKVLSILKNTAVISPDPDVRGVISPNKAIMLAARDAKIPYQNYDNSLNFDEVSGSRSDDVRSNAKKISFDTPVQGTILTIKGEGNVTSKHDQDWYKFQLPSTSGTYRVKAKLTMPTDSKWGHIIIKGWTQISHENINNRTIIVFEKQGLKASQWESFSVEGIDDEDNVYTLEVESPVIPLENDAYEGETLYLGGKESKAAWKKIGDTTISEVWELHLKDLTLPLGDSPIGNDIDLFIINTFPFSNIFPRGGNNCKPYLEISHPNGIELKYKAGLDGHQETFDNTRKELSEYMVKIISKISFHSQEDLPKSIELEYSRTLHSKNGKYDVLLHYHTLRGNAANLCNRRYR